MAQVVMRYIVLHQWLFLPWAVLSLGAANLSHVTHNPMVKSNIVQDICIVLCSLLTLSHLPPSLPPPTVCEAVVLLYPVISVMEVCPCGFHSCDTPRPPSSRPHPNTHAHARAHTDTHTHFGWPTDCAAIFSMFMSRFQFSAEHNKRFVIYHNNKL